MLVVIMYGIASVATALLLSAMIVIPVVLFVEWALKRRRIARRSAWMRR